MYSICENVFFGGGGRACALLNFAPEQLAHWFDVRLGGIDIVVARYLSSALHSSAETAERPSPLTISIADFMGTSSAIVARR